MKLELDLPKSKIKITYESGDKFLKVRPYSWDTHCILIKPEVASVNTVHSQLMQGIHADEKRLLRDILQSVGNLVNYQIRKG